MRAARDVAIKSTSVSAFGSLAPHALLQVTGQLHEHLFAISNMTYEPGYTVLLESLIRLSRFPLQGPYTAFHGCLSMSSHRLALCQARLVPLASRHAQPKTNQVLDSPTRYCNPWVPELVHHRRDLCAGVSRWAIRDPPPFLHASL